MSLKGKGWLDAVVLFIVVVVLVFVWGVVNRVILG